jgi:hypothetical protein
VETNRSCDAVRTELALGLRQLDNNTSSIVYDERPETSNTDGERPKTYVVDDERPAACIYGGRIPASEQRERS